MDSHNDLMWPEKVVCGHSRKTIKGESWAWDEDGCGALLKL